LFHKPICPSSWTISPNSISSDNNSLDVISYKSFSCMSNSIFMFHVWKLLPYNFSIPSKVDAMIVTKTMPKRKNLKLWNFQQKTKKTKIHAQRFKAFKNYKKTTSIFPSFKKTTTQP
jgi:hypothetical protein